MIVRPEPNPDVWPIAIDGENMIVCLGQKYAEGWVLIWVKLDE